MIEFSTLLQQGNAWLFIPSAILLGALHGLEPGHSKTMMAAFIVTTHGTIKQAILLGLSATLSHTIVVWLVAIIGLYFSANNQAHINEPYFQMASAVCMIGLALWMLFRAWRYQRILHVSPNYQDPHDKAHADDIAHRFSHKKITTGQIVLFGLTGGLIPCPGAITVLLLCLQLKKIILGVSLVACFSIGLALTMVASGVLAAWGMRHVTKRWSGFSVLMQRAPYFSGGLIVSLGCYLFYQAWIALPL